MNFIKKNIKWFIAIIVLVAVTNGITAYAASVSARDIVYKNDQSIENALDYLYNKSNEEGADLQNILYAE